MGTCYFLIRDDDQIYDLGKAWEWSPVFADASRTLLIDEAAAFADMLDSASNGWDVPDGYFRAVALDIVDWAEGRMFVFVSEHDGRYERVMDDAFDRDDVITGSRFARTMEMKAAWRNAQRGTAS
jgi:hypothetical protein